MPTARPSPATDPTSRPDQGRRAGRGRRTRGGRRSCWLLGISGLALLVVSVIMMASGAEPSIAQTARPPQAPTRLARLWLPGSPLPGDFLGRPRDTAILGGCVSCVRYLSQQNCGLLIGQRRSILNG